MILEKDQINRYMRQIIMQEIGGAGQKKLLESSVLICCDDLHNSSLMLYYLVAMGIGNITCLPSNASGSKQLAEGLKSLNPYVDFKVIEKYNSESVFDIVIAFNITSDNSVLSTIEKDTPVILAAAAGDLGFIKTTLSSDSFISGISDLKTFHKNHQAANNTLFNLPCNYLIGVLAAIETVKALLKIGCLIEDALYIDIANYNFTYSLDEILNKSTNTEYKSMLDKIRAAKVLIVGSGGLGSPVAYTLVQMGIGKLGLVDFDNVEISNLNRQILHSTDKIGMPKVKSAEAFLKKINPDLEICSYNEKFSVENSERLIEDYDIVVDGLDNLPNRYLLNDTCYFLQKPLMEAGVLAFNGLATAIIPNSGPCYRCTFPEVHNSNALPSCSENGVLGAVPGITGILEAVEVIKKITGIGRSLLNIMILFDALNAEFTLLDIYKEESCILCGSDLPKVSHNNYDFTCSSKKEV